jgi:hypothetical protein
MAHLSDRGCYGHRSLDLRRPRNPAAPPVSASVLRGAHTPFSLPPPDLKAPSSKTLAMQKQTDKSGWSGGGTDIRDV